MKYAGKKATMMPTNDVENAADAKKPGDAKEDTVAPKMPIKKNKKKGGGLAAFLSKKLGK